ncbi:3-oxoacyl-ACP synthase III [Anaerophaga thermohalophila]|uniref:3-oxoacyl-ACP synthase III n=1 Tax=Anaerophaga thermohalophila TaxID=177400 RepID=UPI000237D3FF|nr:3-oxoacyl-ACP synthase III [Anaerophaga thermohalophila]
MIQANYRLKSGDDKSSALGTDADTLSRAMDPHDCDSVIVADGVGAVMLETVESDKPVGMMKHVTRTDTEGHLNLWQGETFSTKS